MQVFCQQDFKVVMSLLPHSEGSVLGDQGHTIYKLFDTVVLLTEVMRQAGNNPEAVAFRSLLSSLRDGKSTEDDWKKLLTRAPNPSNQAKFKDAVRLCFDKQSVAAYIYDKLKSLNTPIAHISAKHSSTGMAASKSDDAGGLDPDVSHKGCTGHAHVKFVTRNGPVQWCFRYGTGHPICCEQWPTRPPHCCSCGFSTLHWPTFPGRQTTLPASTATAVCVGIPW